MSWMSFSHRLPRTRIAKGAPEKGAPEKGAPEKGAPEALVVLLHDRGASAVMLTSIAARWSATVPGAAFIALDGIGELDVSTGDPSPATPADADSPPMLLDRSAHTLAALVAHQLCAYRLDASRLVMVGFGYGGTLALHLLLRQRWSCAGILAFDAELMRPLPRILRIDCKVRLIDCAADAETDHGRLRDKVALLNARGLDTRGVLLARSALSNEAIRHGGAYLVELVATAQRGNRFHVDRESSHA